MDTKAIEARARRLAEQAKPGIVKRDGKIFRGAAFCRCYRYNEARIYETSEHSATVYPAICAGCRAGYAP